MPRYVFNECVLRFKTDGQIDMRKLLTYDQKLIERYITHGVAQRNKDNIENNISPRGIL